MLTKQEMEKSIKASALYLYDTTLSFIKNLYNTKVYKKQSMVILIEIQKASQQTNKKWMARIRLVMSARTDWITCSVGLCSSLLVLLGQFFNIHLYSNFHSR